MFDKLKNLGQMTQMLGKAGEVRQKMEALQESLARREVTSTAGGGLVEATCNGRLELTRMALDFDRLGLTPENAAALESLIVEAVNTAQNSARMVAATEMGRLMEDSGLPPEMLKP